MEVGDCDRCGTEWRSGGIIGAEWVCWKCGEGAREVDIGLTTTPMNCEACGHASRLHHVGEGLCAGCYYHPGPCYPWEFR